MESFANCTDGERGPIAGRRSSDTVVNEVVWMAKVTGDPVGTPLANVTVPLPESVQVGLPGVDEVTPEGYSVSTQDEDAKATVPV